MAAQLLYWKSVCILAWCWWDGHTIESIFTAISVTQLIPRLSGFLCGKKTNKVHFFFLTSHEDSEEWWCFAYLLSPQDAALFSAVEMATLLRQSLWLWAW